MKARKRLRHLFMAFGAIVLALVAAGISTPGQRAIDSVHLLHRLGATVTSIPQDSAGLEDTRQLISFEVDGRRYSADVYGDGPAARAAVLLVPGLAPDGKDDRRLVDLAIVLAQAGFSVLVPDIASLRAQRVSAENTQQIADGLRYLATAGNAASDRRPLGVAAISYAVGPALLATLEPDLEGRIDFMAAIGGYYDLGAVVTYFTTGFYRSESGGQWTKGTPNHYGKWLFVAANSYAVMDMRDRITLQAIAGQRMDDPGAPIDDLVSLLGQEGRAIHALLANTDPDSVGRLIAGLPERLRANLHSLDLKTRSLATAPRHVILIHGRDDRIIPVSESISLNAALPPGQSHLYLADHLAHADLEPGDWKDILTLWRATYRLLELRDGID